MIVIKEWSVYYLIDVLVDEKVNERVFINVCEYYWVLMLLEGDYSCIMCGFLMINVKVVISLEKIDFRRY